MITITVIVSNTCKDTATITVENALCWASGKPYTLEDYAIMKQVENDRKKDFKII